MPDTLKIDGEDYWLSMDGSLVCNNELVPKDQVAGILATSHTLTARRWQNLLCNTGQRNAKKQGK